MRSIVRIEIISVRNLFLFSFINFTVVFFSGALNVQLE